MVPLNTVILLLYQWRRPKFLQAFKPLVGEGNEVTIFSQLSLVLKNSKHSKKLWRQWCLFVTEYSGPSSAGGCTNFSGVTSFYFSSLWIKINHSHQLKIKMATTGKRLCWLCVNLALASTKNPNFIDSWSKWAILHSPPSSKNSSALPNSRFKIHMMSFWNKIVTQTYTYT